MQGFSNILLFMSATLCTSFIRQRTNHFHNTAKVFSHYIPSLMAPEDLTIPILYEDEHIIVYNKPSLMLSVPGKVDFVRKPRHIEWEDAISHAAANDIKGFQNDLNQLRAMGNIPRKRPLFITRVQKLLKTEDATYAEKMYDAIAEVDEDMHKPPLSVISPERISVVNIAEKTIPKVFVVHRLDCETSGAIVLAKTDCSARELCRQFRDREVSKSYLAIVNGHVSFDKTVIDAPMIGIYEERPRQRVDHEIGKASTTELRVLSHGHLNGKDISMVQLVPVTGRTHQLRVHMAHIGHPMLGDTLYAPTDIMTMSPDRLELHAHTLSFIHPVHATTVSITAPITLATSFDCFQNLRLENNTVTICTITPNLSSCQEGGDS